MGCTTSSIMPDGGGAVGAATTVAKFRHGKTVINDSIHTMMERDRRKQGTAGTANNGTSEFRPRAPHPLLSSLHSQLSASASAAAAAPQQYGVTATEDEDDTIVIMLEEDDMSSGVASNDGGVAVTAPVNACPLP